MPIQTREQKSRLKVIDYLSARPDVYASVVTQRYTVDKPTTSKRPRPADLFAYGTARTVRSTESHVIKPASGLAGSGESQRVEYSALVEPYTISLYGPASLGSTRDGCDTRTLLKIKDQKVNLSVSVAELGKTTDMVADFARDTFRFFRSLRKGEFKKIVRLFKSPRNPVNDELASKWLKYQYGVVPTAMEVYGLSEFIYRRITEGYIYGSQTTREHFTDGVYRKQSYFEGVNPRFGVYFRKNTYRYRVSSGGLRSLAQSGITNPAMLIYELIPYSFVVDWFFSIGDYLATLDALVGVEDLLVIRSDTLYQTDLNHYIPFWASGTIPDEVGLSTSFTKRTRRSAPTADLKPGFPRYEPSLGVKRMISGLALLNNLLYTERKKKP